MPRSIARQLDLLLKSTFSAISTALFISVTAFSAAFAPLASVLSLFLVQKTSTILSQTQANLYTPRFRSTSHTLLLLHGLSASGAHDHRITALATALASAGLSVIVPHLSTLARCEITPSSVNDVRALIRAAATKSDRRLHLCAPCISAGIILLAAAEESCCPDVPLNFGSVLLFGAFGSVQSVFDWAFGPKADAYCRCSIILNSLPLLPASELSVKLGIVPSVVPAVQHILRAYLNDDHFGTARPPSLPTALVAASPEERIAFSILVAPGRIGGLFEAVDALESYKIALSPVGKLHGLKANCVVLLHGKYDVVVPASETVVLGQYLRECPGVGKVQMIVTPLLGHGERSTSLSFNDIASATTGVWKALFIFFRSCFAFSC